MIGFYFTRYYVGRQKGVRRGVPRGVLPAEKK